eukprot:7232762-Prymnesium_polylepis.1
MGWSDGRSRPRLPLIGGGFSAAATRCADRNRFEIGPHERSSTRIRRDHARQLPPSGSRAYS